MKKRITVILTLAVILLGGYSVLTWMGKDRTAPVISIPEISMTYEEGTDPSVLLAGVTAQDNRDGNVTKNVRVADISALNDKTKAKVTFAVYDSSYNLAKKSTIVTYKEAPKPVTATTTDAQSLYGDAEDSGQVPAVAETAGTEKTTEVSPEETGEDTDPEKPVIELLQDSVTLTVGETFSYADYIRSVSDDKDSLGVLSQAVSCTGDYNMYQPGIYHLEYFVTDSDGNESEHQKFTLRVTAQ